MRAETNAYPPDLRGFISYLEAEHPEQIVRITKEVDPKFGVSGILHRLEKDERFPLVIFENIKGSNIPLIANMHADFARLRLAIGMEDGDINEFLKECTVRENNPIAPEIVKSGPVQDLVTTGDDVDVTELPICTYHEKDAGKYITAGLSLMRDPDTGTNNIGIYRHQVHAKNLLGIQLSETADANVIWKKYEQRGLPCPLAIIIGHHPAFFIGSLCFSSLDTDELHLAGGMLQCPVPLVNCKTIPLDVPANAEIVLECEIRPHERREEAPFGEYPGTYGPQRMNPVVEIKAITHRKDPLYQNALVGHADNLLLSGIIRTTFIEAVVRVACPTVRQVAVPRSGQFRFMCFIAIEKMIEGEAKQAAMAAFVADPFLKFAVIVDHDVDVYNDTEVFHAIATRVRADHDIFMVPYAKGSPLDPASYDPAGGSHLVTKTGIDATRKDNYPDEILVPGADKIDLADFIPGYQSP
ncbi:MAG: UbiD family decarboxylase [Rhodospirillaceae bacterium]|jgi:2,5-furandicarboxylate decarboxylase 1|nr:UbiD family decarboxylase [Rhodospirillaceae bacterium]